MRTLRTLVSLALSTVLLQPVVAQSDAKQAEIIAVHGRVEHTPARVEAWSPAEILQALVVDDRVRTYRASRAAILFVDETQVKLNSGSILTVHEVQPRTLELEAGEGWFRTKNPASGVTIRTESAAAAIRGTEINVRVASGETVLTVVEGAADFYNDHGSIRVDAGEEATARPGEAPTKRVILNPEDAVQWALYYPAVVAWHDLPEQATTGPAQAGFELLKAGDAAAALEAFRSHLDDAPWARIGASMAHAELGQYEQAREVLQRPARGDDEVQRRAQLAAAALAAGDATSARQEIEQALAIDPRAVRPLVLLSSLELTQNKREAALAAAETAVEAHPDSVAAHVAVGEALQAGFDLRGAESHLDRALSLDATDVHALVNRARLRFGRGATKRAEMDAAAAAALAPDDAQVRSLSGFLQLARGDLEGARADFEAAIGADIEFAEPHLGLGLLHFRQRRMEAGLREMLAATLLEPKVSLYQSYLGKAYYQLERFDEGLSALESAKRLDPRDPTPWLYSSLFLRDQNRQTAAVEDLRKAIDLNDNRAVYRSRLLLDRDLATKNVSLAEIYRQLGFEAWGAYEALNSLNADATNSSAHLFLAETYSNLPDRTQAQGSELLQFFLTAPVNRNSFNTFNEYTALLEQPRTRYGLFAEAGEEEHGSLDVSTRSGNERFAHFAFGSYRTENGPRIEDDTRWHGLVQGKVSLGARTNAFVSLQVFDGESGEDFTTNVTLDSGGPNESAVTLYLLQRDLDEVNKNELRDATLGLMHRWRAGSVLTAAVLWRDIEASTIDRDPFNGFTLTSEGQILDESYDIQVQQTWRTGRHQLIAGVERADIDGDLPFGVEIRDEPTGVFAGLLTETSTTTELGGLWLVSETQVTPRVHTTVGVRYDDLDIEEREVVTETASFPPVPPPVVTERRSEISQWSPYVGLSARVSSRGVLRLAAFRRLNSDLFGSRISPTTVGGFVLDRNERLYADRDEAGASLEYDLGRAFLALRAFRREVESPDLLALAVSPADREVQETGGSFYLNRILTPRWTLFADDEYRRTETGTYLRQDNQIRGGINFIHEKGYFARFTTRYVTQRFDDTVLPELQDAVYALTDLSFGYEFARKRGRFTLLTTNLFDREISGFVDNLTVAQPRPERRITGILSYSFGR